MPPDLKRRQTNVPTGEHIPRPANCFMIFRADWLRKSIANSTPGNHPRQKQKDVSLEAAAAWRNLSPTLKQLYKVQADIVKEEHSKKYPGWIYKPNTKRKKKVGDDDPPDGPPTKRVTRDRTAPYQKPSANVNRERKAEATPFNPITAPVQFVWDSSWFSRSQAMKDPFYSAPIQPIASESSANPAQLAPTHHHFLPPAQIHGFGTAPNFQTMPFMYSSNHGLQHLERYDTMSNRFSLSGSQPSSQATTQAESPISPGLQILSSGSTGDSTPTTGSSMGEVMTPTPYLEAEPPTQALVNSPNLTFDKLLEGYYHSNDWEVDPTFNPGFDTFSMMGL